MSNRILHMSRIMYIYPDRWREGDGDTIPSITHRCLPGVREGLYYQALAKERDVETPLSDIPGQPRPDMYDHPDVFERCGLKAMLEEFGPSLDLIVADGKVSNLLGLPTRVRVMELVNAPVAVLPIYACFTGADYAQRSFVDSNADFGLNAPMKSDRDLTNAFEAMLTMHLPTPIEGFYINEDRYEVVERRIVPIATAAPR